MRVVIGAARRKIHQLDAHAFEHSEELRRLGQIILDGVVLVHAETILIWQAMRKILRRARAELARFGKFRVWFERDKIKRAEAHADFQSRGFGANAGHDFPKHSRAVFQRAAIRPRPRVRSQQLVQQIAVAMFDVHEIRADFSRDFGRRNVGAHQLR